MCSNRDVKIEHITIYPSKIKGKDRPRYRRVGNFVQTYTTKSTKSFEEEISTQFKDELGDEYSNYDGRVAMRIDIYSEMPKSWSNKAKAETCSQFNTNKPDIDNIIKSVLDGLNGVAYVDDKQICDIRASKFWSTETKIDLTMVYLDKIKDLD